MSCSSETLSTLWPEVVAIRLRSPSTRRPIAVDDSARPSAATSASAPVDAAGQRAERRAAARRAEQLHAAPAEDRPAQRPQALRLELEADQEQHQHDAELGEVQDVLGSVTSFRPHGPIRMPAPR